MHVGKVIGTVVPAVVAEGLAGVPLLIVQPLSLAATPQGSPLVCADSTRMAGPGDMVAYEGGREASLALSPWFVPVDGSIVAIVDRLHVAPSPRRRRRRS